MGNTEDTTSQEDEPLGIFISYRREDAAGHAGRLHDSLSRRFPDAQIFFDVETMRQFTGRKFSVIIDAALRSSDVFLALIGSRWTEITQTRSRERRDWVRREIAAALERDIPFVPLTVEDARMPDGDELPEDIAGLGQFQAQELRNKSWHFNIDELAAVIRDVQRRRTPDETPVDDGPRHDAEEEARRAAEQKAERDAQEKAQRAAQEKGRRDAEEEARRAAEEKARRAAEEKGRRDAEEEARRAAEEKARRAAEEKARRDATRMPAGTRPAQKRPEPGTSESTAGTALTEILDQIDLDYERVGETAKFRFPAVKTGEVEITAEVARHDIILFTAPTPDPNGPSERSGCTTCYASASSRNYTKAVASECRRATWLRTPQSDADPRNRRRHRPWSRPLGRRR